MGHQLEDAWIRRVAQLCDLKTRAAPFEGDLTKVGRDGRATSSNRGVEVDRIALLIGDDQEGSASISVCPGECLIERVEADLGAEAVRVSVDAAVAALASILEPSRHPQTRSDSDRARAGAGVPPPAPRGGAREDVVRVNRSARMYDPCHCTASSGSRCDACVHAGCGGVGK